MKCAAKRPCAHQVSAIKRRINVSGGGRTGGSRRQRKLATPQLLSLRRHHVPGGVDERRTLHPTKQMALQAALQHIGHVATLGATSDAIQWFRRQKRRCSRVRNSGAPPSQQKLAFQAHVAAVRQHDRVGACHALEHADHLARVAVLVVVPDVENHGLVGRDGREAVHDAGAVRADEVGRDDLGGLDVVDLLTQLGVQRNATQVVVRLVAVCRTLQRQVQHGHRDIGGGNADRVAGELALELGQRLRHGLRGTGLGDDHVQRRRAAAAVALVEVVDQVLVVGVRVHGLDVTVDDAVGLVNRGKHRRDRVRRARCCRHNCVSVGDLRAVHAVHDVLHGALAGSGEQHARDAGRLQVLAQALGIAPAARVVDEDRVLDAVLRVVDARGIVRVDDLDAHAVGGDGVVFFVDGDGAIERTVHRVATQQAGTLDQVVLGALAHNDGTQAQAVAAARVIDDDAGEQAADAAEAVEHDVALWCALGTVEHLGKLLTQVGVKLGIGGAFADKTCHVNRRGVRRKLVDLLEHGESFIERELTVAELARLFVSLDDAGGRQTHQALTVNGCHHAAVAVQGTNVRDHPLGQLFVAVPRLLVGVEIVHAHPCSSTGSRP
uniref:NAD-specific glutamate dehydrogenase n=1 Tax=Parastrongyloides trichosuri TaxID=131310 RepID=A0A0N4ZIW0_PARTI